MSVPIEPTRPGSPDPTEPAGRGQTSPDLTSRGDAERTRPRGRRRRDPEPARTREDPSGATAAAPTTPGATTRTGGMPPAAPPVTTTTLGPGVPSARAGGNAVGWTALLLAVVLTAWQAVYALAAEQVSDPDLYQSVALFVSLVLGLAAAVLGIVALAQRRLPRWPGLVALAVGLHVFVVSLFAWVGGIAGGA